MKKSKNEKNEKMNHRDEFLKSGKKERSMKIDQKNRINSIRWRRHYARISYYCVRTWQSILKSTSSSHMEISTSKIKC